jgi:hypothetical protein
MGTHFKGFRLKYMQTISFRLLKGRSCNMNYILKLTTIQNDIEFFVIKTKICP